MPIITYSKLKRITHLYNGKTIANTPIGTTDNTTKCFLSYWYTRINTNAIRYVSNNPINNPVDAPSNPNKLTPPNLITTINNTTAQNPNAGINPGSPSYPRQENRRPSYIIMEIDEEGEAHFSLHFVWENT